MEPHLPMFGSRAAFKQAYYEAIEYGYETARVMSQAIETISQAIATIAATGLKNIAEFFQRNKYQESTPHFHESKSFAIQARVFSVPRTILNRGFTVISTLYSKVAQNCVSAAEHTSKLKSMVVKSAGEFSETIQNLANQVGAVIRPILAIVAYHTVAIGRLIFALAERGFNQVSTSVKDLYNRSFVKTYRPTIHSDEIRITHELRIGNYGLCFRSYKQVSA